MSCTMRFPREIWGRNARTVIARILIDQNNVYLRCWLALSGHYVSQHSLCHIAGAHAALLTNRHGSP